MPGFRWGSSVAEIRYTGRTDLAVMACVEGTVVGGVYTKNRFTAAPVLVCKEHKGPLRGVVVNSGNANAATGQRGLDDARESCRLLASQLGCKPDEVLPFSTGVIGEFLPMKQVAQGIEKAASDLADDGWEAVARAIMTTDTQPKGFSHSFAVQGERVTTTGIVKGAGMIRPDMATMLAFQATDACISEPVANQLVQDLTACSFNRLTVDGDTSTNDSYIVAASGLANHTVITDTNSDSYRELLDGMSVVARKLAEFTVRDAEGATKFVTITVKGGRTETECLAVAFTIAHSPLVKTALFAGDPNWGRFCMAIGRSAIDDLNPDLVSLWLNEVQIAKNGLVADSYVETDAAEVMAKDEFEVIADLGRGQATAQVLTSDFSYEYVKINAEYRT